MLQQYASKASRRSRFLDTQNPAPHNVTHAPRRTPPRTFARLVHTCAPGAEIASAAFDVFVGDLDRHRQSIWKWGANES